MKLELDATVATAKDLALEARLADMSPAMRALMAVVVADIDANFASESAAGENWAPLADSTIRDRKAKGFAAGPILQRTGALRRSASAHQSSGAHDAEVGPDGSAAYVGFHMAAGPRSKIPLRDAIVLRDTSIDKIDTIIAEFIENE